MKGIYYLPLFIVAIMALGLTGCDDKKAETETPPPANSQPAAPAPEAPVAKAEAKPETPAQPVVDEQAVSTKKWMSISSAITSYRSLYRAVWRVMLTG